MLTYVNTIVRVSESLFVHTGDRNRPGVAMIEKTKKNSYIIIIIIIGSIYYFWDMFSP